MSKMQKISRIIKQVRNANNPDEIISLLDHLSYFSFTSREIKYLLPIVYNLHHDIHIDTFEKHRIVAKIHDVYNKIGSQIGCN